MVNRDNYRLVKDFVAYLANIMQLKRASISRYEIYLRPLLLWLMETPFKQAHLRQPTLGKYLLETYRTPRESVLAPASLKKVFQITQRFFHWLKRKFPTEFMALPIEWIDALKSPHQQTVFKDHEFVSLDEVHQLAELAIPESDLAMRRDQAAACLLYLSGMRASVLGSLKIECVDLTNREIKQWPSLGVKTKNGKAATTYLLPIPELMAVAERWDQFVQAHLPRTSGWYAPVISEWGEQRLSTLPLGAHRHQALAKRLRKLYALAGLSYKSPHKFRHGHAVYGLQRAKTMADYKAISMNLMHGDIRVTDSIYATLSSAELKDRVMGLSTSSATADAETAVADEELAKKLIALIRQSTR